MNIAHLLSKPLLAITPDKEIDYGPWHQLGLGAFLGGAPVGAAALMKRPLRSAIPTSIAGLALGISALPFHNALVKYKQEKKIQEAEDAITQHFFPESDPGTHVKNIFHTISKIKKSIPSGFSKEAKLMGKVLDKATELTGKGLWGGTRAVTRSLFPLEKNAPIGEKILGGAVKSVAVGSVGYGTFKGIDYLKKKQPYNYTTMLRNNILHGKIHPSELNSNELQEVKRLGMK